MPVYAAKCVPPWCCAQEYEYVHCYNDRAVSIERARELLPRSSGCRSSVDASSETHAVFTVYKNRNFGRLYWY